MTLMQRRRALIGQKNRPSDILFELLNYAVETGQSIDTGVKPFQQGVDCTILLDIQIDSNPTASGGVASTVQLLRVYDTTQNELSFALGKQSRAYTNYSRKWMSGGWSDLQNTTTSAGRKRFAITHSANSVVAKIQHKMGNGSVESWQSDRYWHSVDNDLYIGYGSNTTTSLASGKINLVRVYNRVLSQDEIAEFFA